MTNHVCSIIHVYIAVARKASLDLVMVRGYG